MVSLEEQFDSSATGGAGRSNNRNIKVVTVHFHVSQHCAVAPNVPGETNASNSPTQPNTYLKITGFASDTENRQRWLRLWFAEAENVIETDDEPIFVDHALNCQHHTGHKALTVDRVVGDRQRLA